MQRKVGVGGSPRTVKRSRGTEVARTANVGSGGSRRSRKRAEWAGVNIARGCTGWEHGPLPALVPPLKMLLPKRENKTPLFHIVTFFGVPNTWQILKIVSISLAPGKSGRRVYTSAMMQPTAQMSMGEL